MMHLDYIFPRRLCGASTLALAVAGVLAATGGALARDGVPNPEEPPPPPVAGACVIPQPTLSWLSTEDATVNLETWDCGTWSHAYGVSADGSRIAGSSARAATGIQTGFYLDDGGTMQPLPFLTGGTAVDVRAISADGGTIGGGANSASGWRAVIWQPGNSDLQELGSLGGSYDYVFGLNADGSVAVGVSNNTAFRWDAGTGMSPLTAGATTSMALGVSADGNRVVGVRTSSGFDPVAVFWDWNNGAISSFALGWLPGGNYSEAWAINGAGSVIVGDSQSTDGMRAFRWTEAEGMVSLGVLDGAATSHARAVNADGSVVVGWSGGQAMRWQDGVGMEAIPFLTGGSWSYALGVSANGQIVVGAGDSTDGVRAFAWNSEVVESTPIDIDNTVATVQAAAQDIGAAAASRNHGAMGGMERELDLPGPGSGPGASRGGGAPFLSTQGAQARAPIAFSFGAGLLRPSEGGTGGRADVMAVVGLGERLQFGGFLELGNGPSREGILTLDGRQITGGLWLRHRAADFTGLTWRIAALTSGGDVTITRADILPDTEAGSGATRLSSRAASAEIGWGMATGAGVVIPFARIAHARTTRGAYDETDAIGFPLSFDAHEETLTSLTLGLDSRFTTGAQGTLRLSAGITRDLARSRTPITGTSAIPGFEVFAVDMPEVASRTRPFVTISYSHAVGAASAVTASASASRNPWSTGYDTGLRLGFETRF